MIAAPVDPAKASNSLRRLMGISRPVGYWWDGVTKINRGRSRRPRNERAAIEPYAANDGSRRFERRARSTVAGTFEPGDVARIEQHPGDQLDRRLRGRRDDDLTSFAPDASMLDQMSEQRSLERGPVQCRRAGCKRAAGGASKAARPQIVRKRTRVGQSRNKRPWLAFVREGPIRLPDS